MLHRKGGAPTTGRVEKPILDHGKRSITLDLKGQGDRDIALALIDIGDGPIEWLRPGVMERLGLGPTDLQDRNRKLVYGRMTGWGQDSPMAARAGHDLNYISLAGALWHASPAGVAPRTPPTLVCDIGGGVVCGGRHAGKVDPRARDGAGDGRRRRHL